MELATTILSVFGHVFVLGDATTLVDSIRTFIAPIVLLACSIAALKFLFDRAFMQMIIFAVAAILVFSVFYVPSLLGNLGKSFGESNKGLTWN